MSQPQTIMELFEGSVVNPYEVMHYCIQKSWMHEHGIQQGYPAYNLPILQFADKVSVEMRDYLGAISYRLTRLYRVIWEFMTAYEKDARFLIPFTLDHIRGVLLSNEWYELLPRFDRARALIRQRFTL